jgi:hypothetical protein
VKNSSAVSKYMHENGLDMIIIFPKKEYMTLIVSFTGQVMGQMDKNNALRVLKAVKERQEG